MENATFMIARSISPGWEAAALAQGEGAGGDETLYDTQGRMRTRKKRGKNESRLFQGEIPPSSFVQTVRPLISLENFLFHSLLLCLWGRLLSPVIGEGENIRGEAEEEEEASSVHPFFFSSPCSITLGRQLGDSLYPIGRRRDNGGGFQQSSLFS